MIEASAKPAIRFDRNELAGAFGDIGTDLPLIIGMILAAHLDAAGVLILFGAMQILTGLFYRMPMPAQPLKAVAVMVIAQKAGGQKITPELLFGGGLAIGLAMLLLSLSGLLDWMARVVPKIVVRGIQFGLGLQLSGLALKDYLPHEGSSGYVLGTIAFLIGLFLWGNRKYPAALFIILIGMGYALAWKLNLWNLVHDVGFSTPRFRVPGWSDVATGFLLLAVPQIPLSIGNSILAARQTAHDLFPERAPGIRKIGLTYSIMNLINPFFGGVPTCHGSGGLAGHYAFGARTGGSVIIYGSLYLSLGLFFSRGFDNVVQVFPRPVLGIILLFEGVALMLFIRDSMVAGKDFFIALLVGLAASSLPYGYLIGLVGGTLLARSRWKVD